MKMDWSSGGVASWPSHFTPRERAPDTHWIGDLVGPRAGLDAVWKDQFKFQNLEQTIKHVVLGEQDEYYDF
jgi:hypothetical protein